MKASVIVCVYEREREIVRCLESVVASLEDETEIVVVDAMTMALKVPSGTLTSSSLSTIVDDE